MRAASVSSCARARSPHVWLRARRVCARASRARVCASLSDRPALIASPTAGALVTAPTAACLTPLRPPPPDASLSLSYSARPLFYCVSSPQGAWTFPLSWFAQVLVSTLADFTAAAAFALVLRWLLHEELRLAPSICWCLTPIYWCVVVVVVVVVFVTASSLGFARK